MGEQSKIQALPDKDGGPLICVHWHVKTNYWEYWRVKASITNYDVVTNYRAIGTLWCGTPI
jgi:hypothetical protein